MIPTRQRSKTGCQACRNRKRKCDEQHPQCAACIQRGVVCTWERDITTQKYSARRKSYYNKSFTVTEDVQSLTTVFAAPQPSMVDHLLSYFFATSPLWITIGGEKNRSTCLRAIMPVAIRDVTVRNCVLALAAGDLSKSSPASAEMSSLSHGFYGHAVNGLQLALSQERRMAGRTGDIHTSEISQTEPHLLKLIGNV
jgi:hypothetical protein